MKVNQIINRGYKAIMSTGDPILIEQDEIDVVMNALAMGRFIKVRQGILNPSFVVSVVEDRKRRIEFLEDTKYMPNRRAAGMAPLKDIFSTQPQRLNPPALPAESG